MGKHTAPGEAVAAPVKKSYAKFWVASVGFLGTIITVIVSYLSTKEINVELIVTAVITFLTAIGVYQIPNKDVAG